MFQAQIHGKLTRQEEDAEDLLTSNVFGAFKYVTPDLALVPFLCKSVDKEGRTLADCLSNVRDVEYSFWPWMEEHGGKGAEPDVLITLDHTDRTRSIVLIEAKLYSGKSSPADDKPDINDQLAREYDNLAKRAERERIESYFLVYCTADIAAPWEDIAESCAEYGQKRGKECTIYWLSWRVLTDILLGSMNPILKDLREVLLRQNMFFYKGVPALPQGLQEFLPGWQFHLPLAAFAWPTPSQLPDYSFAAALVRFEWHSPGDLNADYRWRS